jgi:transketolase
MQQAKLKRLTSEELDQLAINTIRTLSIDAVQQAKSGHPNTPMALAPLVYTIWNRVLGSVLGWDRYVGAAGRVIGMETIGASAPLKQLQHKFGFEPERVVAAAMEVLGRA